MSKFGNGVQLGLSWVPCRSGRIPANAIDIGNGVLIARGTYQGDLIPGKAIKSNGKAYVSYGGAEYERSEFEVLCDTSFPNRGVCYAWQSSENGQVPKKAVVGGVSSTGEPLYIARGQVDGQWIAGKIHPGHSSGYFPLGGQERAVSTYEVLVLKKK